MYLYSLDIIYYIYIYIFIIIPMGVWELDHEKSWTGFRNWVFFVQHRDGPRINDVRIKNLPSGLVI